jgi:hypothetical protein
VAEGGWRRLKRLLLQAFHDFAKQLGAPGLHILRTQGKQRQ